MFPGPNPMEPGPQHATAGPGPPQQVASEGFAATCSSEAGSEEEEEGVEGKAGACRSGGAGPLGPGAACLTSASSVVIVVPRLATVSKQRSRLRGGEERIWASSFNCFFLVENDNQVQPDCGQHLENCVGILKNQAVLHKRLTRFLDRARTGWPTFFSLDVSICSRLVVRVRIQKNHNKGRVPNLYKQYHGYTMGWVRRRCTMLWPSLLKSQARESVMATLKISSVGRHSDALIRLSAFSSVPGQADASLASLNTTNGKFLNVLLATTPGRANNPLLQSPGSNPAVGIDSIIAPWTLGSQALLGIVVALDL
ncbi:hypothetical protein BSKO_12528 [Bryopsis sp. KO-2023]|nr:hypothetical protein BSKO_12528 [Bryopsis sp. KO-2023]